MSAALERQIDRLHEMAQRWRRTQQANDPSEGQEAEVGGRLVYILAREEAIERFIARMGWTPQETQAAHFFWNSAVQIIKAREREAENELFGRVFAGMTDGELALIASGDAEIDQRLEMARAELDDETRALIESKQRKEENLLRELDARQPDGALLYRSAYEKLVEAIRATETRDLELIGLLSDLAAGAQIIAWRAITR